MNIRNVLLIIFGTVVVSVSTAIITVKMIQPTLTSNPAVINETAVSGAPYVTAPPTTKNVIPPPPPAPSPVPTLAKTKGEEVPIPNLESIMIPKEFDPNFDSRKPLTTDEVVSTLLKNTPACEDEYKELCTGNRFLAEHPLACLRSKKDKLSGSCAGQISAVQDKFRSDCATDIEKFCPEQRRYFPCLKSRFKQLSKNCQANIKEYSRK